MNVSLAGMRALATGSNPGIGEAIALAFGAAGAAIVPTTRSRAGTLH
jgi:NAD(P)-dependent dehydrogenase (short-subunit alcohol dehydrogenase family)